MVSSQIHSRTAPLETNPANDSLKVLLKKEEKHNFGNLE